MNFLSNEKQMEKKYFKMAAFTIFSYNIAY